MWVSVKRGLVLLLLLLIPAALAAQSTTITTGDIKGKVTDESGTGIAGVVVVVENSETGFNRLSISDAAGDFVIRLMPPGVYKARAELEGVPTVVSDKIRVTLGSTVPLDFTLQLAAATVSETIVVRADAGLINPAGTDVGKTIGEEKIMDLPINQRDFLAFTLTTPGVVQDRGPQSGAASTSGLSFNGQSPRYNNIVVDGLDNNDSAVGSVRNTFSQDAVKEYQVISSPYAAEYGRTSGGIVNIVTRSGTNDFSGSAFYFFRDDSLSEDNPLTNSKTPFEQNQYGLSLGGPIVKDKAFFFGAYERIEVDDANVVTIPDNIVALIRSKGFDIQNGVVPFSRETESVLLKFDVNPTVNNFLTARFNYGTDVNENQQVWGGTIARAGGGVRDVEDLAGALSLTSILSPRFFNEVRGLYSDRSHDLLSLDPNGSPSVTILGVATFGTQRFLPQPRDTTQYQLVDAISMVAGRHTLKLGVDFSRTELSGSLPLNFAGLYVFSALPPNPLFPGGLTATQAFGAGVPAVSVQAFGDPNGDVDTTAVGVFSQGDFQLGERFLLKLGLRYDYEDPIAPFETDDDNVAPRLSFSWQAGTKSRLRGGAGRFYGVSSVGPMFAVSIQNGVKVKTLIRSILGGPSPIVPWNLPGRRFPDLASAGVSPLAILREGEFESAYTDQASLGFDQQIGENWLFNADLTYAEGKKIFVARNINPVVGGARPDPRFTDIFLYESSGESQYKGGTLGLQSRFGGPFEMSAYYTYADAEDNYIDWLTEFQLQNPLNPDDEFGPSAHTPTHKAILTAIFNSGTTGNWFVRDWLVSTILEWNSGRPYNILAGFDRNQNGDARSDRPAGEGRNSGEIDDFINVDLRLARSIPMGPVSLQLILEAFNLFDRDNVVEVQNVQAAPGFGNAVRVSDPRRLQLGLRLGW